MKKITLLCIEKQKDETLKELRSLGLFHIEHVQEPASHDLEKERNVLERADSAAGILHHYLDQHGTESDPTTLPNKEAVELAHELHEKHQNLTTLHDERCIEAEALESYGEINPDTIKGLQQKGINIKFYSISDKQELSVPDGAVFQELSDSGSTKTFALISADEIEYEGTEVPPPEKILSEVRKEIESLSEQAAEVEKQLTELSVAHDAVEAYATEVEDSVTYIEARDGMGESGKIAYMTGYCPADLVDKVREASSTQGWGLIIEEPTLDDKVPTLIKYPKIVRPVKAVLDMLGITPGYNEADISSIFLVFFSVFFAMLIGDAGYGLLILGATIFARKKQPKAANYPFTLFYILSICTIIWGVLTNNYFGIKPEILPEFVQNLRIPWLTDGVVESRNHIMKLSFFIGACHLTIAHIWNSIVIYPNKKWIAQIGWIMLVWTMYFSACSMVISEPFPFFAWILLGVSVSLILLFMSSAEEFKQEKIGHIMFPLTLVSCFVDVISYIRLFAVGMASLSVAQSFNDMASMVQSSNPWLMPLILLAQVLILLFGHGLNIALCALGILVHGVRLNTLEFSVHKELEWAGSKYNPFKKTKTINN